jgi:hypothetical protein
MAGSNVVAYYSARKGGENEVDKEYTMAESLA